MTKQNSNFTPGFGSEKFGCDFFQSAKPNPDSVVSKLIRGTSVAVLGLRRIGKTSLLAETRERLQSMGKHVIWVDLDANDSPTKALSIILSSMRQGDSKGVIAGIKDWAENTEMIPAELKNTVGALISGAVDSSSPNYNEKYVELLFSQTGRLLESQDSDNKPIIIIDELTTLIKSTIDNSKSEETRMVVGRLNSFLGLLRYWRKGKVGISMAVSGSVSFNWLNRQYGIRSDSINDCVRVNIEEMDRNGAKKLLEMCVEAESLPNWKESLSDELLDTLPAYYPGVVQLAFEVVCSESDPVESLSVSIRRKIYQALWDHYFQQFDARFKMYGTSERVRIKKLFDALESNEGEIIDTKEIHKILNGVELAEDEPDGQEIISKLKSDSFIDIVPGGICFSSGLVPAWRNNIL